MLNGFIKRVFGSANDREVKKIAEDNGYAVAISGAGPTLLAVGKKDGLENIVPKQVKGVSWSVVKLNPCDSGAILK